MRSDHRESLYEELVRESVSTRPLFDQCAIEASVNIALTFDTQQSYVSKPLYRFGLAKSSLNILVLLRYTHPEGLQLSKIGELLITSRANVTGLVGHLEQKGYVKRIIDAHDRRARLAKLTKKGEALLDQIMPAHMDRNAAFFSNLSLEEVRQLTGLLRKLRRNPAILQTEDTEATAPESVLISED